MTIQVSSAPTITAVGDRHTLLMQLLSQRPEVDEAQLSAEAIAWVKELRHQAVAQVQTATLPSQRDEEWRFTDLSPLLHHEFLVPSGEVPTLDQIASYAISEAIAQLVFVDGRYVPQLSSVGALPEGAIVGSLLDPSVSKALADVLPKYIGQQPGAEEVFTALNTAGLNDVAVVWVAKNVAIAAPIHVLYLSTGDVPTFSQPRCIAVASPNSAFTLVETFASLSTGSYFTNPVTEIWVEDNAEVNHVRLQHDSPAAIHISKTAVTQQRSSRYRIHDISTGAALSRRNLEVFHRGEQVETLLNGLTMVSGTQVADTHSLIDYHHPHCTSRQLHKCIVDDKAHAVFNGKVNVPKPAQLTDAGQLNRCLLLSPKARVDTKPQLEITADNVKCTHGATVSQLDADEVFYFQSRGIDAASAQSLLIYAFAFEIIDQIPIESVKTRLMGEVSPRS